jgi:hypothetical protein
MSPRSALALALGLSILVNAAAGAAPPKPKPSPAPEAPPPPSPGVIDGAVLQGLDKISARVTKFTVPFGQTVKFGTLSVRVTECRQAPPEEEPESAAFLDIQETQSGTAPAKGLFHGWMFASSPALNPLEHPVYDVWVLDCSTSNASPGKSG